MLARSHIETLLDLLERRMGQLCGRGRGLTTEFHVLQSCHSTLLEATGGGLRTAAASGGCAPIHRYGHLQVIKGGKI